MKDVTDRHELSTDEGFDGGESERCKFDIMRPKD
jgi:hypothetical protein